MKAPDVDALRTEAAETVTAALRGNLSQVLTPERAALVLGRVVVDLLAAIVMELRKRNGSK